MFIDGREWRSGAQGIRMPLVMEDDGSIPKLEAQLVSS